MNRTKYTAALERRRRRQSGQQILEFACAAVLFCPLLLGTFVVGLSLIRSIQVNHLARDLDSMYIHGADFSTYNFQVIARRLANGMGLDIGAAFDGNMAENTSGGGRGLITISQVMWVGGDQEPNCQGVFPAPCTNKNNFVFTQRIRFGNGSVDSDRPSSLGAPTSPRNSHGIVQSPVLSAGARLPSPAQGEMQALWQTSAAGRTPLKDGQILYVVEAYFQSPDLSLGSLQGSGLYARWFF